MVHLLQSDLYFICRVGPIHIASQPGYARWHTLCGRDWHRDQVSELTDRESSDSDPDSYICKRCKSKAPDGAIRIED